MDRPGPAKRHSSGSVLQSMGRSPGAAKHTVVASKVKMGARVPSYGKNINKMVRGGSGHAGQRVVMPRTGSKVALRKNQSETALVRAENETRAFLTPQSAETTPVESVESQTPPTPDVPPMRKSDSHGLIPSMSQIPLRERTTRAVTTVNVDVDADGPDEDPKRADTRHDRRRAPPNFPTHAGALNLQANLDRDREAQMQPDPLEFPPSAWTDTNLLQAGQSFKKPGSKVQDKFEDRMERDVDRKLSNLGRDPLLEALRRRRALGLLDKTPEVTSAGVKPSQSLSSLSSWLGLRRQAPKVEKAKGTEVEDRLVANLDVMRQKFPDEYRKTIALMRSKTPARTLEPGASSRPEPHERAVGMA